METQARRETSSDAARRRGRQRFDLRRHRMGGADFQRAYGEGSRARAEHLMVVVRPNGLGHTRVGLSVGKRCWRRAALRNRVRRVFREAFRLSLAELPSGLDVVLIPAQPALRPELETIRRELVAMTRKAHRRYREKRARPDLPARPDPPDRPQPPAGPARSGEAERAPVE